MTAKQIIEAGPDPDDPNVFLKHFRDAWGRAGFEASMAEGGQEKFVWRDGKFSVEVIHHLPDETSWRGLRGAANYEIYAFIDVGDGVEDKRQSAYARKIATTDAKALALAVRLKNEIANSMAARLSKLGFTGWRNHWHRAPITVSLKKNYANIKVSMDYVPNERVIPLLTALTKTTDRIA
jgi:hypothetical protein